MFQEAFTQLKQLTSDSLPWLGQQWQKVRRFLGVLNLVRFNILVLVTSTIIVGVVGQGQEALLRLDHDGSQKAFFVVFVLMCGFSVWYTSRIMFLFEFLGNPSSDPDCYPGFKAHFPRWLGALVPLVAAFSLIGVDGFNQIKTVFTLLIITIIFLVIVYKRRKLFKLAQLADEEKSLKSFKTLPVITRTIMIIALLLNVIVMVLIIFFAIPIGQMVGALGLLYLGSSLLVFTGGLVVYWGNTQSFPVVTALLLLAIGFSYFNDNHWVRHYRDMSSTGAADQTKLSIDNMQNDYTLEHHFKDWIKNAPGSGDGKTIPVVLVSAEGGGIRAAYWTATVLAELQDRYPDFYRHVFAISGVSGGSLGSAMFVASLPGDSNLESDVTGGFYRKIAKVMFEHDFLSPVTGTLLFPDLLQRFLPWSVFNDRAITLETTWEDAWETAWSNVSNKEKARVKQFAEPFDDLWNGDIRRPLLFLNSTVVETGQRIIVNPLKYNSHKDFQEVFNEALDARQVMGGGQLPLSTSVHMSARFTYVSPAGTIEWQDQECSQSAKDDCEGPQWLRVVDGGYFENSGTVTAQEILTAILNTKDENTNSFDIKPIIIHISNDPLVNTQEVEYEYKDERVFMGEVLSPVRALLNVRPARGYQARKYLEKVVEIGSAFNATECNYFHFSTKKTDIKLPLGWTLSERSMEEMDRQLLDEDESGNDKSRRKESGTTLCAQESNDQKLKIIIKLLKRSKFANGMAKVG